MIFRSNYSNVTPLTVSETIDQASSSVHVTLKCDAGLPWTSWDLQANNTLFKHVYCNVDHWHCFYGRNHEVSSGGGGG